MSRSIVAVLIAGFLGILLAAGAAAGEKDGEKGYLGVLLGPSTDGKGAVVQKVFPDTAAQKAGIQVGDRILRAGGEDVAGPDHVGRKVGGMKAGDALAIAVERGAETLDLNVTLAPAPEALVPEAPAVEPSPPMPRPAPRGRADAAEGSGRAFLGIGFAPVHPEVAAHLGLGEDAGVAVGDVLADSAAARAGLERGDLILAIDGKEIRGPEGLLASLAERKPGEALRMDVVQRGVQKSLDVTLGERPASLPPQALRPAFPHGPDGFPWGPTRGRSGRVIIQGPDGMRKLFQLPDRADGALDVDRFLKDFESELPDLWRLGQRDEMVKRFKKLFDELHEGIPAPGAPGLAPGGMVPGGLAPGGTAPGVVRSVKQSSSSVVRVNDGVYDVTIRDEDGIRTVDAKKDGKTIAESLPFAQVNDLPEDVRAKVEEVAGGIRVHTRGLEGEGPEGEGPEAGGDAIEGEGGGTQDDPAPAPPPPVQGSRELRA